MVVILIGAAVIASLPSRSGRSSRSAPPSAPTFGGTTSPRTFDTTPDPETERARGRAEAAVHPLADQFVAAVVEHTKLRVAYALMTPELRSRYSLEDWQHGRNLPLKIKDENKYSGATVAFSDASIVGLVGSLSPSNAQDPRQTLLVAMRFEKSAGRWRLAYVHQGHASSYVTASNYAPTGFSPGSTPRSGWTWVILVGGLGLLIALAVVVERKLSGPRA